MFVDAFVRNDCHAARERERERGVANRQKKRKKTTSGVLNDFSHAKFHFLAHKHNQKRNVEKKRIMTNEQTHRALILNC